jgi:MFS family permease
MSIGGELDTTIDAPTSKLGRQRRAENLYAWYVVVFLTLAATVSIIDRQILALMIGPVKRDLGVSNTMMGLLGGFAFTSFYTLLTWPMARLADSRSRRNLIAVGIFFWSLATVSCGLAARYWQLFIGRMGVGLGETTLYPSAVSMLSDYFDRTRLPLALGVFSCASFIGIGLANILGGLVIGFLADAPSVALPGFGMVRSWQAMFIFVGAPGLIISLLTFSIREPFRTGRVEGTKVAEGEAAPKPTSLVFFRARGAFLVFLFGSLIALAIQAWGFFFWIVELLVRGNPVNRGTVAISFGISALVFGTLGSLTAGWISGRMMRRGRADATVRLALAVTLLLIPAGIVMPLIDGFGPAMIMVSILLFLMGCPGGLLTAAMQLVVPNEFRGRMVAMYFIFVNFVSFSLGPLFGGLISDQLFHGAGFGPTLALMAVIDYPVAAILIWKCLPHFRRALRAAEAWQSPAVAPGKG